MPNMAVGPTSLVYEEDDENSKVDLSFSYTYENNEKLDFTEISAVLKRSDGVLIAETNSTTSSCGNPGAPEPESLGFYWLDKTLIPKDKKELSVSATIKLGKIKTISAFSLALDEKKNEMPIEFELSGVDLEILGGSLNIGVPDEEKCVDVNLVICVRNNHDRYYPELKMSYELVGGNDVFLDGDDGIIEVKPLSYTYITRSIYIKKSKLKKAKLQGQLQLSDYVISTFI